jgi:DUF1009 family protein
MKLGIIAGNRLLPIILTQKIKEQDNNCKITAVCFNGETSRKISQYTDKQYWINPGHLGAFKNIIKQEGIADWIMAGQINPMRIFRKKDWDGELSDLVSRIEDFRPHTVFIEIINYFQKQGVNFLDSTRYLGDVLSDEGVMNGIAIDRDCEKDIDFGLEVVSRYVDLDVGQTIMVKKKAIVALESLEGTDRTISRGYRLAGRGCTMFKFSKTNQDLRFDVPVVGISTLKLLRRIGARACVFEKGKVIILDKEKFLSLAKKWNIAVVGKEKIVDSRC